MVGTSLNAPGGMTAVVTAYREGGLFAQWRVTYLNSYEAPGFRTQLRVMASALFAFLRALVFGHVVAAHIHTASRGSFWRKSIFCALARCARVPYVLHVHSGEFPDFVNDESSRIGHAWVRFTLRGAARVIALTEAWRKALLRIEPKSNVVVIGNPVVVPEVQPAHRPRGQHVVFLGRVRSKKGVFDLIRAIPAILDAVPDARFTLAGDGELAEAEALARSLDINHAVKLPGWVDEAGKADLLASADALVLPSYFEGLPICVLEAMAAGVPVVATSVGGIPEVIEHEESGWLVMPGDVNALSAGLRAVLMNESLRARLTAKGYARVRAFYARETVLAELGTVYRNIAGTPQ